MTEVTATLEKLAETGNIAETLARELKGPVVERTDLDATDYLLPPGWRHQRVDDEPLLIAPRRKQAAVMLNDAASFIAYASRHGQPTASTIWCKADFSAQQLGFRAVLDDHEGSPGGQHWRTHTADFTPALSEEWKRWAARNNKPMPQVEFAAWIEENLRDITTADGFPTGSQMLEMALNLEAQQESRFRSKVRLQSGGVALEYVATDDDTTVQKMAIFERFALGIPVFWNGSAYGLEARLRYRIKEGRVEFWYQLIRPDKVFEQAAREIINTIGTALPFPLFHGTAGLKA